MAKTFRPNYPYSTAIELLIPQVSQKKGVTVKEYPKTGNPIINCDFRTYGGTETTNNDIYTVVDTAQVETWYRPDITSDCRIKVLQTGTEYEIINTPENINMRNQFVKFKVQAVKGNA